MSSVEVVYDAFVSDPLQLDIQSSVFQAWVTGITPTELINDLHTTLTQQFQLTVNTSNLQDHRNNNHHRHHNNKRHAATNPQTPQQQAQQPTSQHQRGSSQKQLNTTTATTSMASVPLKQRRLSVSSSSSDDSSPSSPPRRIISPIHGQSPHVPSRRPSKSQDGRTIVNTLSALQLGTDEDLNTGPTTDRGEKQPQKQQRQQGLTAADDDDESSESDDEIRLSSHRAHHSSGRNHRDVPFSFSTSSLSASSSSLTAAYSRLLQAAQHQIHTQYRIFLLLEHNLRKPQLLLPQPSNTTYMSHSLFQLSIPLISNLCHLYYTFDHILYRELIGMKLRKLTRGEIDVISGKSGIRIMSGWRQFENLKRLYRYRWPEQEEIENNQPTVTVAQALATGGLGEDDDGRSDRHQHPSYYGAWKNVRGVAASLGHAMRSASLSLTQNDNNSNDKNYDDSYPQPFPRSLSSSSSSSMSASTISFLAASFCLPTTLARHYTQMIFLCHYRFNTTGKKMLTCRFDDLMLIAHLLMQKWCIPVGRSYPTQWTASSSPDSSIYNESGRTFSAASLPFPRLFSTYHAESAVTLDRQISGLDFTSPRTLNANTFAPPTAAVSTPVASTDPSAVQQFTSSPAGYPAPSPSPLPRLLSHQATAATDNTSSPAYSLPPPLLEQQSSSPTSLLIPPPATPPTPATSWPPLDREISASIAGDDNNIDEDNMSISEDRTEEDDRIGDVLDLSFIEQLRSVKIYIADQRKLLDDYTTAVLNILREASLANVGGHPTNATTTTTTPSQHPRHMPTSIPITSSSATISSGVIIPSIRPILVEKLRPRVLPLLRVLLSIAASLGKHKKIRSLFIELQEDVCKIGNKSGLSVLEMKVLMTAIHTGFEQINEIRIKMLRAEKEGRYNVSSSSSSPPQQQQQPSSGQPQQTIINVMNQNRLTTTPGSIPPSPHSIVHDGHAMSTPPIISNSNTSMGSSPITPPISNWSNVDDETVRCYLHWHRFLAAVVPITCILYQRMIDSQS